MPSYADLQLNIFLSPLKKKKKLVTQNPLGTWKLQKVPNKQISKSMSGNPRKRTQWEHGGDIATVGITVLTSWKMMLVGRRQDTRPIHMMGTVVKELPAKGTQTMPQLQLPGFLLIPRLLQEHFQIIPIPSLACNPLEARASGEPGPLYYCLLAGVLHPFPKGSLPLHSSQAAPLL